MEDLNTKVINTFVMKYGSVDKIDEAKLKNHIISLTGAAANQVDQDKKAAYLNLVSLLTKQLDTRKATADSNLLQTQSILQSTASKLEVAEQGLNQTSQKLDSVSRQLETTVNELQGTRIQLTKKTKELEFATQELQTTKKNLEQTSQSLSSVNEELHVTKGSLQDTKVLLQSKHEKYTAEERVVVGFVAALCEKTGIKNVTISSFEDVQQLTLSILKRVNELAIKEANIQSIMGDELI